MILIILILKVNEKELRSILVGIVMDHQGPVALWLSKSLFTSTIHILVLVILFK